MLLCDRSQHNIVKQSSSNQKKIKKWQLNKKQQSWTVKHAWQQGLVRLLEQPECSHVAGKRVQWHGHLGKKIGNFSNSWNNLLKKSEIPPFAAMWMHLEMLIPSEGKSERERQMPYMWDLKYDTIWTYLQNRNKLIGIEKRLVIAKGGKDCEFGRSRLKLVHIGYISNKVLLYSTGNYIQYPVIDHIPLWITLLYGRN